MPMTLSALEIMEKLISFPTVSHDSNLDLIDWVEEYLNSHGVKSTRVPNEDGTKAAIYANVGPEVEGGVILSGHTDVVPVDGQAWDTDPFSVVEKDGKYFGRGTCDMKGFDAIALAAVPLALEQGVKRPLQIALSYDEEIGCTGAPPMIDHLNGVLPKAGAVIVGEPSMMKAVTGHKGGVGFRVDVTGFEVHSSLLPDGVSAVMEAARLISWLNEQNAVLQAAEPSAIAAMFNPPHTTLHAGVISGGTAQNITAKDCSFSVDMRVVPDESPDEWRARFRARAAEIAAEMAGRVPGTGITVTDTFDVPGLKPEDMGAAETLARAITGDNGDHVVSYGTEAGQFQERGHSAVICGPGDIAQAHQPNEYVTKAQFEAGIAFTRQLVADLAKG